MRKVASGWATRRFWTEDGDIAAPKRNRFPAELAISSNSGHGAVNPKDGDLIMGWFGSPNSIRTYNLLVNTSSSALRFTPVFVPVQMSEMDYMQVFSNDNRGKVLVGCP